MSAGPLERDVQRLLAEEEEKLRIDIARIAALETFADRDREALRRKRHRQLMELYPPVGGWAPIATPKGPPETAVQPPRTVSPFGEQNERSGA
jgi:hypothetical protein